MSAALATPAAAPAAASVPTQDPDATGPAPSDAWRVHTASGLSLYVPPSLRSISTHVLLEQERWFEPEIDLLPLLLGPEARALDIGANHGVYALEMARCASRGRVWAFEPTSEPGVRLQRSVQLNGFESRLTVVRAALADRAGTASFAVHDNSELNSRSGTGARRETVQQLTLDGWLAAQGLADTRFALVKLDAEGDELRVLAGGQAFFQRQSPVVLFEYKHGAQSNDALLQAWAALGFDIFRFSAELSLLLPFDPALDETAFALNLVAVRPAVQAELAARGLLVTAQALVSAELPACDPDALVSLCASPALLRVRVPSAEGLRVEVQAAGGEVYAQALGAVASAHYQAGLQPAQRLALVLGARDAILAQIEQGHSPDIPAWTLLVHTLQALGQQRAAVEMAGQLLRQWSPDLAVNLPVLPPQRGELQRARSTPIGPWLRQVVAEFAARQASFSGCFLPPDPARWTALLAHPDHSAEVERRCLLAHVLSDRVAAVDSFTRLPKGSANAPLWQGLMASMQLMGRRSAAAAAAPAAAGGPATPEAVLDLLPVAAVAIVDVGASSLGQDTEPYAALVRHGRARVTGFEPDAAALAQLHQLNPDRRTHRFLPHVVGNGQPAVFHQMHWSLTSSLLPPARPVLDRFQRLGELVQVKATQPVHTVRLDDVIEPGGMDLLKIDVQGAEGLVFDGAPQRLAECLVVWTEVEFVPLYEGQPVFGDIDAQLRRHGLQFLCFTGLAQRCLAGWPAHGVAAPRRQQQLWADAIYVPTAERIAALSADAAARLALLAHHVLQAYDLCHAALQRVDVLGGRSLAAQYLAAQQGRP